MTIEWDELRLTRAIEEAEEHGCSSSGDVQPLVTEVRRLRSAIRDALYDYDHRDELSAVDRLRAAIKE